MGVVAAAVLAAGVHFLAIAIALLSGYATYGREPRSVDEMPLLNEPPDDLSPGEVASLDGEGEAGGRAWTATVLDLISRGVIVGGPVAEIAGDGTAETGYGIVRVNEGRSLLEHEEAVRSLYERVVENGPVARVDLRTAIRHTPAQGGRHVTDFKIGVRRRLTARAYAIVDARTFGWAVVASLSVAAAMTLLVLATVRTAEGSRLEWIAGGVLVGTIVGAVLATTLAKRPGLWVSRSDAGSRARGRWSAHRRYLINTLGDWPKHPIAVSRGDRTTAFALALGLMPAAEEAWGQALPKGMAEPGATEG